MKNQVESLPAKRVSPIQAVIAFDLSALTNTNVFHAYLASAGFNVEAIQAEAKATGSSFSHVLENFSQHPEFWKDPAHCPRINRYEMEAFAHTYVDYQLSAPHFLTEMRKYVAKTYGNGVDIKFTLVGDCMEPLMKHLSIAHGYPFDSIAGTVPILDQEGDFKGISKDLTPEARAERVKEQIGAEVSQNLGREHLIYIGSEDGNQQIFQWVQGGGGLALGVTGKTDRLFQAPFSWKEKEEGVETAVYEKENEVPEAAATAELAQVIGKDHIVRGNYFRGGPIWDKVVAHLDHVVSAANNGSKEFAVAPAKDRSALVRSDFQRSGVATAQAEGENRVSSPSR